jgi:hypothetical protein
MYVREKGEGREREGRGKGEGREREGSGKGEGREREGRGKDSEGKELEACNAREAVIEKKNWYKIDINVCQEREGRGRK